MLFWLEQQKASQKEAQDKENTYVDIHARQATDSSREEPAKFYVFKVGHPSNLSHSQRSKREATSMAPAHRNWSLPLFQNKIAKEKGTQAEEWGTVMIDEFVNSRLLKPIVRHLFYVLHYRNSYPSLSITIPHSCTAAFVASWPSTPHRVVSSPAAHFFST